MSDVVIYDTRGERPTLRAAPPGAAASAGRSTMAPRFGWALAALLLCGCAGSEGPYNGLELRQGVVARTDIPAQPAFVRRADPPMSTLLGTPRAAAADAIIKLNTDQGAALIFRNDFGVIFSSRTFESADKVNEGSYAGRDVEVRLKFDLSDDGANTRVVLSVVMAEFPNTSREIDTDISSNPKIFKKSMAMLEALNAQYPANKP
jgi:hypothetical protein